MFQFVDRFDLYGKLFGQLIEANNLKLRVKIASRLFRSEVISDEQLGVQSMLYYLCTCYPLIKHLLRPHSVLARSEFFCTIHLLMKKKISYPNCIQLNLFYL